MVFIVSIAIVGSAERNCFHTQWLQCPNWKLRTAMGDGLVVPVMPREAAVWNVMVVVVMPREVAVCNGMVVVTRIMGEHVHNGPVVSNSILTAIPFTMGRKCTTVREGYHTHVDMSPTSNTIWSIYIKRVEPRTRYLWTSIYIYVRTTQLLFHPRKLERLDPITAMNAPTIITLYRIVLEAGYCALKLRKVSEETAIGRESGTSGRMVCAAMTSVSAQRKSQCA